MSPLPPPIEFFAHLLLEMFIYYAMYFDHIHPPAPMSTTSSHSQLYALFFFIKRKNYTPLSSISAAHMDMGKGPTLKQGELTRGHATKGE